MRHDLLLETLRIIREMINRYDNIVTNDREHDIEFEADELILSAKEFARWARLLSDKEFDVFCMLLDNGTWGKHAI